MAAGKGGSEKRKSSNEGRLHSCALLRRPTTLSWGIKRFSNECYYFSRKDIPVVNKVAPPRVFLTLQYHGRCLSGRMGAGGDVWPAQTYEWLSIYIYGYRYVYLYTYIYICICIIYVLDILLDYTQVYISRSLYIYIYIYIHTPQYVYSIYVYIHASSVGALD